MTVSQVGAAAMTGRPTVWCVWFDGQKKLDDTFSPEALKSYVKPELPSSARGIRSTQF